MNMGLAPRPANEELRAQTVVKTGLIDAPNPDLFQIYCDLAKDITGFETATFSLYDGEMQCSIAGAGREDFTPGSKTERGELNVCSYVLLDTEPLLMEDMLKDPTWQDHPNLAGLDKGPGYAGFPVINSENFALGTLCMMNFSGPKGLNDEQIAQVKKITSSIAHMLDLQIKQKELTSQRMLEALSHFQKVDAGFGLDDFKTYISLCSELNVSAAEAETIIGANLAEVDGAGRVQLSEAGRKLQFDMNLQQKGHEADQDGRQRGGRPARRVVCGDRLTMFAKIFNFKFNGVAEAKVAASFISDAFGKLIVTNNMRSLNISIGKCGSLSIQTKFENSDDLKAFEVKAAEVFRDLKETMVYKEDTFAGVYIFNYEAEAIKAEVSAG